MFRVELLINSREMRCLGVFTIADLRARSSIAPLPSLIPRGSNEREARVLIGMW
jgi:hypothetical protein